MTPTHVKLWSLFQQIFIFYKTFTVGIKVNRFRTTRFCLWLFYKGVLQDDHLSKTTTFEWSQEWSSSTGLIVSVILLSMLMIRLATLNVIGIWFVATNLIGFWTWIWFMKHCGVVQEVTCWFQCWKNSTGFIWLVW